MASQPATGGRSMRHDRRCFGRLGQEDQRLKHYGRWMDIVDHAAPRAPGRWTTARPTKGMKRSRGRHAVAAHAVESMRVHWFGCGVRLPSPQGLASGGNSRGGEAFAAAQPATGGRSMRHDRRCFGRLEQEDQRLKKHYGRWMDIVRSLELESFILTKVDKGPRPSQLSSPTSPPPTMVGPS